MAQQYPQATFVTIPLSASNQSEKERIEKIFPQKMMKNVSIAQIVFACIAALTQVLNLFNHRKSFTFNAFYRYSSLRTKMDLTAGEWHVLELGSGQDCFLPFPGAWVWWLLKDRPTAW